MGRKRKQPPPPSHPRKWEVNKWLQEFAESPEGQRWRGLREQLQNFAESPDGKRFREAGEQLRKFADSPAGQEMVEQVRRFEASPTARGLRELTQQLREIEAEEHQPPRQRNLGGRPPGLTSDQIKAGKQLAIKHSDLATKELCDLLRRELGTKVSDDTMRRRILNPVRT